jgi:hypothetical protein
MLMREIKEEIMIRVNQDKETQEMEIQMMISMKWKC